MRWGGRNQDEAGGERGEVCGLYVRKAYRKQGFGTTLLKAGLEYLEGLGFSEVIVYNFRQSVSNGYYRKLGGKLVKQTVQEVGGKALEVDVFGWQISELKATLTRD